MSRTKKAATTTPSPVALGLGQLPPPSQVLRLGPARYSHNAALRACDKARARMHRAFERRARATEALAEANAEARASVESFNNALDSKFEAGVALGYARTAYLNRRLQSRTVLKLVK